MKINCLIVDDEPLAREGLENYVRDIDFLRLAGSAPDPLAALPLLEQHSIDLLLLDIEMPKLSGLDFLRSLRQPPLVILTTAYPNYALEGYELEVLDYLLKPITYNRFLQAVLRARRRLQERLPENPIMTAPTVVQQADAPESSSVDHFFIKADGKIERILIAELLYVEAMQNYIQLYTERGRFTTLLSLRELSEKVISPDLMRVHKSYLANLSKVTTIDGRQLCFGDQRIPVSRSKWEKVEQRLLGGQLLG
jgi:DNA-binding LytR/AlgR family response regulator